jgi:hypothetical protein
MKKSNKVVVEENNECEADLVDAEIIPLKEALVY